MGGGGGLEFVIFFPNILHLKKFCLRRGGGGHWRGEEVKSKIFWWGRGGGLE